MPRLSVEPGRAIAGPSTFTLYEVGTVKDVRSTAASPHATSSVDGGMSDNIRTALYDADYTCTLASRGVDAPPVLARVVGQALRERRHRRPRRVPAGRRPARRPARRPGHGAYCRSMASNYNHVPRPPVVAVRDGKARVIVRRETEDDLLALDAG